MISLDTLRVHPAGAWTRITAEQADHIRAVIMAATEAGNRDHPAMVACDWQGRWTANAAAVALLGIPS